MQRSSDFDFGHLQCCLSEPHFRIIKLIVDISFKSFGPCDLGTRIMSYSMIKRDNWDNFIHSILHLIPSNLCAALSTYFAHSIRNLIYWSIARKHLTLIWLWSSRAKMSKEAFPKASSEFLVIRRIQKNRLLLPSPCLTLDRIEILFL